MVIVCLRTWYWQSSVRLLGWDSLYWWCGSPLSAIHDTHNIYSSCVV